MIDVANAVNWTHPLAQGLVAWWLCLPGLMRGANFWNITSAIDATANRHKGVLTNFAMPSSGTSGWNGTDRPGGFGHIVFDGVNDTVVMDNILQFVGSGVGPTTLACWVNVVSHLDGFDTFVSQSNNGQNFDLLLDTSHIFSFYLGPGGLHVDSTTVAIVGTWYHVTAVFNGISVYIFVNGHLEGQVLNAAQRTTPAGTFELGGSAVFGRPANVRLDDVRLYQYPMNPAQVSAMYGNSLLYNQGLLNDSNVPYAGQVSSVNFRRTLSAYGTRVGSRQHQGA